MSLHPALFAWLLASAVASVLWYGALVALKAANRHLRAASLYVLISAAAVGLAALLLVWTSNLANAGLALIAMDATMTLYTLRITASVIDVHPLVSLTQAANPFPLLRLARGKVFVR